MAERQAQQKIEAPEHERRVAVEDELQPELESLGAGLDQSKTLREPPLAHPTARGLRQASVLGMQQSVGNAAVARVIRRQPRLTSDSMGTTSQHIPQSQTEPPGELGELDDIELL